MVPKAATMSEEEKSKNMEMAALIEANFAFVDALPSVVDQYAPVFTSQDFDIVIYGKTEEGAPLGFCRYSDGRTSRLNIRSNLCAIAAVMNYWLAQISTADVFFKTIREVIAHGGVAGFLKRENTKIKTEDVQNLLSSETSQGGVDLFDMTTIIRKIPIDGTKTWDTWAFLNPYAGPEHIVDLKVAFAKGNAAVAYVPVAQDSRMGLGLALSGHYVVIRKAPESRFAKDESQSLVLDSYLKGVCRYGDYLQQLNTEGGVFDHLPVIARAFSDLASTTQRGAKHRHLGKHNRSRSVVGAKA